MSAQIEREQAVARLVFRMENNVLDVERWATALSDLSCTNNSIRSAGLYVMADCLERTAKALREEYDEVFRLTRVTAEVSAT